jgi:hypothetical protein
MLQIVAPLTDNSRGVIYNRNIFIEQATGRMIHCQILILIKVKKCKKKVSYERRRTLATSQFNKTFLSIPHWS